MLNFFAKISPYFFFLDRPVLTPVYFLDRCLNSCFEIAQAILRSAFHSSTLQNSYQIGYIRWKNFWLQINASRLPAYIIGADAPRGCSMRWTLRQVSWILKIPTDSGSRTADRVSWHLLLLLSWYFCHFFLELLDLDHFKTKMMLDLQALSIKFSWLNVFL